MVLGVMTPRALHQPPNLKLDYRSSPSTRSFLPTLLPFHYPFILTNAAQIGCRHCSCALRLGQCARREAKPGSEGLQRVVSCSALERPFPLELTRRAGSISPIVVPSPQASGSGDWASAIMKAKRLVHKMTLEELVNITSG